MPSFLWVSNLQRRQIQFQQILLKGLADITKRINHEESLRESEEKYRTILESIEEGYFETEEGEPAVRTQGKDLTLITLGPVLYSGMKVVEEMKEKYGMEVELIDLRFVNPLNYDKIVESVKKTGRVVFASDAR